MVKEFIKFEKDNPDGWICICGNMPAQNGFFTCDKDGNEIEPTIESNWDDLYVCNECGRIIKQTTLEIVGKK